MRTLSNLVSGYVAQFTRNNECRYSVEASIAFHFFIDKPTDREVEALERLILEIDAESPWLEEPNPITKEVPKSIYFIHHKVVRHNWSTPEYVVWFTIAPEVTNLRRAQVPAYEKYVYELAQRVQKRGFVLAGEMPLTFGQMHINVQSSRTSHINPA